MLLHHESIFQYHIQAETEITIHSGLPKNKGVASKEQLNVPGSGEMFGFLQVELLAQLPNSEALRRSTDTLYMNIPHTF